VEDARSNQCKEGKHKNCDECGQGASEPHRFGSRRRRRIESVRVRGGSVRIEEREACDGTGWSACCCFWHQPRPTDLTYLGLDSRWRECPVAELRKTVEASDTMPTFPRIENCKIMGTRPSVTIVMGAAN
jgi:hypothetical protein